MRADSWEGTEQIIHGRCHGCGEAHLVGGGSGLSQIWDDEQDFDKDDRS